MNWYKRGTTSESTVQTLLFSITRGNISIPLAAKFEYKTRLDKWYVTIMDGATMEDIITNVPVVGCSKGSLNNVLRQFLHKGIGSMVCLGNTLDLSGFDPYGSDITAWGIYWGDEELE